MSNNLYVYLTGITAALLTSSVLTPVGVFAQTTPQSTRPDVIINSPTSTTPSTTTTTTTTTTPTTTTTTVTGNQRFNCEYYNGQYTVMYRPQGQNVGYPWAVPSDMGGMWSPQKRCQEISARLEAYRPDGLLELLTAKENGYNVVCVTSQKVPACRIVFTVPNGQDPETTRDRVFQNIATADSGQQTQGINTFTGNGGDILNQTLNGLGLGGKKPTSRNINLRPFLSVNDGGTGTKLTGGVAPAKPTQPTSIFKSKPHKPARLNPNLLR